MYMYRLFAVMHACYNNICIFVVCMTSQQFSVSPVKAQNPNLKYNNRYNYTLYKQTKKKIKKKYKVVTWNTITHFPERKTTIHVIFK